MTSRNSDRPAPSIDEVPYESQIDEIRRLYASGDAAAALELAGRVTAHNPMLPRAAVPVVTMTMDAIRALPLDHRAAFIFDSIDGTMNVQAILDVSGMEEDEALLLLEKLVALGALTIVENEPTEATLRAEPVTRAYAPQDMAALGKSRRPPA